MRPRVLIADDHDVARQAIRNLVQRDTHWEICGEAVDGRDAIEKVQRLKPELLIMDVVMPRMSGIEALQEIQRLCPSTKVILISFHDSPALAQLARFCGAHAFLTKMELVAHLNEAITALLAS